MATYPYRESRRESRRAGKERATSSRAAASSRAASSRATSSKISKHARNTRRSKPASNASGDISRIREDYLMTGANPFIEAAGTSRDYLAPGPRAQYPRPMSVYTHSQLGVGSGSLPDSGYGSKENKVPVGGRRSTTQRSRKRATRTLWACPMHSITTMAVGVYEVLRAVGAVSVGCCNTTTPSVRTQGPRRPRRDSGASRHPQHRHMQTQQRIPCHNYASSRSVPWEDSNAHVAPQMYPLETPSDSWSLEQQSNSTLGSRSGVASGGRVGDLRGPSISTGRSEPRSSEQQSSHGKRSGIGSKRSESETASSSIPSRGRPRRRTPEEALRRGLRE